MLSNTWMGPLAAPVNAAIAVSAVLTPICSPPPLSSCLHGYLCQFNHTQCSCMCYSPDGPVLRRPCSFDTQCPLGQVCFAGETWCGFCVVKHQPKQRTKPSAAHKSRSPQPTKTNHSELLAPTLAYYSSQDMALVLLLGFCIGAAFASVLLWPLLRFHR
ncbi:hypothetical protein Ae201684P_012268 [Aphanomyces euteiches]|uniref:Uncharacterized protein n=1 Tax=Aphanomyces euteiches TaxID=100861 RepID=A0A6G0W8U8_9STRA|nr:hypothetical protein Ae201684_017401 [Aphanomyces euteiches]KAH9088981.1 hypothetical protein Ae201684P_012268 [Aphanomyces euteiches]